MIGGSPGHAFIERKQHQLSPRPSPLFQKGTTYMSRAQNAALRWHFTLIYGERLACDIQSPLSFHKPHFSQLLSPSNALTRLSQCCPHHWQNSLRPSPVEFPVERIRSSIEDKWYLNFADMLQAYSCLLIAYPLAL